MVKRLEDSVFDDLRQLRAENESLKKQLSDMQQDLNDARSGWEAAVELNRELEEQLAQARGQALEEAAKIADVWKPGDYTSHFAPQSIARAIRALISPPTEAKSE